MAEEATVLQMDERSGYQAMTVKGGTGTLDLALRIVRLLSEQRSSMSLAAIAEAFSATKPTVHRHLKTLQSHGFVRRDPVTGHYQVGIALLQIAEACRDSFDVARASRDALTELSNATGQASSVAAVVDGDLVVLDMVQGRSVIDFGTKPGTRLTLHASALGKIWLVFGPENLRETVLASKLSPLTPETLTDPVALRGEFATIRERGWADAPNQTITGINTVAAPVFDHRGILIGALGVTGSIQFVPAATDDTVVGLVTAAAKQVSREFSSWV
jgi:DNA-binding IclR family transcriptional regulator